MFLPPLRYLALAGLCAVPFAANAQDRATLASATGAAGEMLLLDVTLNGTPTPPVADADAFDGRILHRAR